MNMNIFYKIFLTIIFIYLCILSVNYPIPAKNEYPLYTKYHANMVFPEEYKIPAFIYDPSIEYKIQYPCIIKPTVNSGSNNKVDLLKNKQDLKNYLQSTQLKNEKYMIQEFYEANYEIGILYEKIPIINKVMIRSMVLKPKKHNTNEWMPLKCGGPLSSSTIDCKDVSHLLNDKIKQSVEKIFNSVSNVYAGRLDIGCNTLDDFKNGIFKIYEMNGVMGYDLRVMQTGNDKEWFKFMYLWCVWWLIRALIGCINLLSLRINIFTLLSRILYMWKLYYYNRDYDFLFQSVPL
jgi:hypothetical protein